MTDISERMETLAISVERLREDHEDTRRRVERLESVVLDGLREVRSSLSDVGKTVADMKDRFHQRDADLAKELGLARRTWPTGAIIVATAALSLAVGVLVAFVYTILGSAPTK